MKWHNYKQKEGAHPEFPWWCHIEGGWRRSCGWLLTDNYITQWCGEYGGKLYDMLVAMDKRQPLPVPGPRCGQVWYWPNEDPSKVRTEIITSVGPVRYDGADSYQCAMTTMAMLLMSLGVPDDKVIGKHAFPVDTHWPPPGAILVASIDGCHPWAGTSIEGSSDVTHGG